MALAGSRTRQMQRIPWKFDGISGTKCRSLAQYITHKAHSPRNLRRLLLGTRTGYHSGDGRHWLAASGQLGRSRPMTSRDRVLATTQGQSSPSVSMTHDHFIMLNSDVSTCTVPVNNADKQRVLMHRHQGWNVRHGLCHIYMRYLYIYELFIAFVCFIVCSLL